MKPFALAIALLAYSSSGSAGGPGSGFAENLRPLVSARQAGSGSLALVGMPGLGNVIEAYTLLLEPDLRWYGFGVHTGIKRIHVSAEGFGLVPDFEGTTENLDGSYGGSDGKIEYREWGGRVLARGAVWEDTRRRLTLIGRASGWMQEQTISSRIPYSLEAGAQIHQLVGERQNLTAWALAGPLGRGVDRWHVKQGSVGVGYVLHRLESFWGREDGLGLGVEALSVGEGLIHYGIGGVYWYGQSTGEGSTFFLRAGARHTPESIQEIEPHAGAGYLWRNEKGFGFQIDYAMVPLGDLGSFNYVTLSMRLPPPTPHFEAHMPARPEPTKWVEESAPEVDPRTQVAEDSAVEEPTESAVTSPTGIPSEDPEAPLAPAEPALVPVSPTVDDREGELAPAPVRDDRVPDRESPVTAGGVFVSEQYEIRPSGATMRFDPRRGQNAYVTVGLNVEATVEVAVLDPKGKVVRTLMKKGRRGPERFTVTWDGLFDNDKPAQARVKYILRVSVDGKEFDYTAIPLGGP